MKNHHAQFNNLSQQINLCSSGPGGKLVSGSAENGKE